MSVIQVLSATTHKLRIVVDANATTNESRCTVNYSKQTATTAHTGLTAVLSATTGTTAVDLVGPPGASEEWSIVSIVIWNRDTVDHTYTIYLDVSGTIYNIYTAQRVLAGKSTILAVSGGGGSSSGGVFGPGSSTNRAIATWNGTAGDTLYNNSNNTIDSSGNVTGVSLTNAGTVGGDSGFVELDFQTSTPAAPSVTGFRMIPTSAGAFAFRTKNGSDTYTRSFPGTLTADRAYTLPDKPGTVALLNDIFLFGGRLTLTTGVAVTTSDVTAAGTLYYTPYKSGFVTLFDGTYWKVYSFTERSLSLTLTSGKNYDVFLYNNSGTLTLELSAAWTNDTTRADALTTQDGVYVKSGATTRLWLGTIRASGSNTTEDSLAKRFVWNWYNQVPRLLSAAISTTSYTYASATIRQCNAQSSYQNEIVTGLAGNPIEIVNGVEVGAGNSVDYIGGIGEDSTTAFATNCQTTRTFDVGASVNQFSAKSTYNTIPALGYHYYAGLEKSSGTATVYGTTYTPNPSAITSRWRA